MSLQTDGSILVFNMLLLVLFVDDNMQTTVRFCLLTHDKTTLISWYLLAEDTCCGLYGAVSCR